MYFLDLDTIFLKKRRMRANNGPLFCFMDAFTLSGLLLVAIGIAIGIVISSIYSSSKSSDGVLTVNEIEESVAAFEIYVPIDKLVTRDKITISIKRMNSIDN